MVISDTHCGCQLALCPPDGARLDEGGRYRPNKLQRKLWGLWEEFWQWVDEETHGEPYGIVHNGDAVDGVHHNATNQWSHNLEDQADCAYAVLAPHIEKAAAYYHVRGTEAHVAKSAREEERLAKRLGATPDSEGRYARWTLKLDLGKGGIVHFAHHIGTTGSAAYESSAPMKELAEAYGTAARWGGTPPALLVRSHRHQCIGVSWPVGNGVAGKNNTNLASIWVTPAWQGKTPFAYKIAGARQSQPQFGGLLIKYHEKDAVLFVRAKVWTVEDCAAEKPRLRNG